MNTALAHLSEILHRSRAIPSVRVSSARAQGRAKHYRYWDAVRYEIRLDRQGRPTNVPLDRARSTRRSERLATRDAAELASRERRVLCSQIGRLTEQQATAVLRQWSLLYGSLLALEAACQLRAIPRWTDRCLEKSGLQIKFLLAVPALTVDERAAVEATQLRILQKRQRRAAYAQSLQRPATRVIRFRKRGIELMATVNQDRISYYVVGSGMAERYRTWRAAIRHWLQKCTKRFGTYWIYRTKNERGRPTWTLAHHVDPYRSRTMPRNRRALAALIRQDRRIYYRARMAQPDPSAPDTLGWRVWQWDCKARRLLSPTQGTIWHTPELRVKRWSTSDAVRGVAGIHAARLPRDWRRADLAHADELAVYNGEINVIIGVVERFGKYVLGTEGWRAEIVIIRKLRAPNTKIGLELEKAYPDVEVYYEDR